MTQTEGSSCDEVLEAYSKKMQMSRCASDVLFVWLMLVAPLMFDEMLSGLIDQDSSNNERCSRL
jgi:hypothetical protein